MPINFDLVFKASRVIVVFTTLSSLELSPSESSCKACYAFLAGTIKSESSTCKPCFAFLVANDSKFGKGLGRPGPPEP